MYELPAEVKVKPLVLVGLTGLDVSNPTHRSIWDAFNSNRRSDGATVVQFKLINANHEFPTVKPKHTTYDWYVPKGILKRNWMNKYLKEIPALVVVFYELEWNDSTWNEKKMECASRVQSLRAALEGRNSKIAVVLIQRGAQPPPGEEIGATERASALCAACELPAKNLYVLPHGDHLSGYTLRLESAFYDLAQTFYHHEYRYVKNHREQLNKTTHQYLLVRHQFKMGFLNELQQEKISAHKHYQQAYSNLLDMRITDANLMEIKAVASLINYKLCKLLFSLTRPKDAIAQFKNHIERFKVRTGPAELIFEHHAWMASQYSTFAELFDDAIKSGLSAIQTQHPGYFFHLAAKQTIERRTACNELCKGVEKYPDPDPLEGEEKLEFYGQRPLRVDAFREAVVIQALQYREKKFNHSLLIVSLLGNAMSQFKTYRCPRMRRFLAVQMADEYFKIKDYGKVLTLLMLMLWDYHVEKWPVLLTDILKNALKAAYLACNIQDYIILALESLGPSTNFTQDRKEFIFANIKSILDRKAPSAEPDLTEDLTQGIPEKWAETLGRAEPLDFTIDDSNSTPFAEVKARFSESSYAINSTIVIEVFVRNLYHDQIELSKITASVNNMGCNTECILLDPSRSNFIFQGRETRKFVCQFQAMSPSNANNQMQITSVSLFMGRMNNCCIILRYTTLAGDVASFSDRMYPEIQQLRGTEFDRVKPLVYAQIQQEECNIEMKVESKGPALIGEWFPIKVVLLSPEDVSGMILRMALVAEGNNDQSTDLSINMIEKQPSILVELNDVAKGKSVNKTVFIRAHKVGDRNISIKMEYNRSGQRKCYKELSYLLPFVKPFEVTTQFYTMLYEPLTKGFIDEPMFIMPHITCTSPWPIKILQTSVELANAIEQECDAQNQSILSGTELSDGESATDAYCVIPKVDSEQPTNTGVYTIRWQRLNSDSTIETSSSVTLTPLKIEDAVIGLEAKLPAFGWVLTPLRVSYYLRNHSEYLITLRLNVESSDGFLFAGHKQVEICILPESEKKIDWILQPLISGFVLLPSLKFSVPPEDEYKLNTTRLEQVLERCLPSHIYIMPKSQTSAE